MASQLRTAMKVWQPVIGLEIHAQLSTKSKLFSGAGTSFMAATNTQVSYHDVALPGTLPILNRQCVELGVRVALALNCKINLRSEFDRKHYFYADLPAGYQITQQRRPIANDGYLSYLWRAVGEKKVHEGRANIVQVQLEQDSGKSLHHPGRGVSYIDLNRAGIGLVEIVTAPDFSCGSSAAAFVYQLREVLMAVGACSGDMSQGALRVDANISVHRPGDPLGVRSEVKNLNSLAKVRRAIEFEIERQKGLLERGEKVVNETRTFDTDLDETLPMRDKEKLQDYRYCPEPNLPPLNLQPNCTKDASLCPSHSDNQVVCVECVSRSLPPLLPPQRRQWLHQKLGLPLQHADVILVEPGFFNFLLDALPPHAKPHNTPLDRPVAASTSRLAREVAYWMTNFCLGQLRKAEVEVDEGPWTPAQLVEVAQMRLTDDLDQPAAKALLMAIRNVEGETARQVADRLQMTVINDPAVIRRCCEETVDEETKCVADIKKGKRKRAWPYLLRKACEKMDGRMNTALVEKELQRILSLKEAM